MLNNNETKSFLYHFLEEHMLGLIGLVIIILGILITILGNTAPLIRLYFGDKSVITQILWGGALFIIGALILIYNAVNM